MHVHTARLIGMTKPVGGIERGLTAEALLAYCARVSNTANQENHATGPKLLRSLVRRKEWSPFEMVSLTFEIATTRDVSRQIIRHRSLTFQEFSQRYAEVEEELILRAARDQHPTDRQSSTPTANDGVADWWLRTQIAMRKHVTETYQAALSMGIAKEVARTILPEGMTPTRLYAQGTLRSWIHYVQLRVAHGTQDEHQRVAGAIWNILTDQFPALVDVLADVNP